MIDYFDSSISKMLEEAINSVCTPILFTGVSDIHGSYMASLLYQNIGKKSVIIVANEIIGERVCNDINSFIGAGSAILFPARELIFRDIESASRQYEHTRLFALSSIVNESYRIIVIPVDALHQITIPIQKYKDYSTNICVGDIINLNELVEKLLEHGYSRSDMVAGTGQFSVRGEILDIFPTSLQNPIRIDFWDDEVDTIYQFNLESQRKTDIKLDNVCITPAREVLISNMDMDDFLSRLSNISDELADEEFSELKENIKRDIDRLQHQSIPESLDRYLPIIYSEKTNILDYFSDHLIFIFDPVNTYQSSKNYFSQYWQEIESLIDDNVICTRFGDYIISGEDAISKLNKNHLIMTSQFTQADLAIQPQKVVNLQCKKLSSWNGNIINLIEDIKYYLDKNFRIIIFSGTDKMSSSLYRELNEKFRVSFLCDVKDNDKSQILISHGSLSSGMEFPENKLVIITYNKIIDLKSKSRNKKYDSGQILKSLEDLSIGDYVVHVENGIGIFDGIQNLEIQGIIKDYVKIKYAGGDILYVPVTQLDLVSKYIGSREDSSIRLNKLGNSSWQKTRQKVKSAVKDIAKDLIKLQSERMNSKGFAFSQDNDWQHQFEETFEYEETDDQIKCIDEIKHDMQLPIPMDRLLCGDVGFGKTEVALRAAFKAVIDSKQVAILVPTTILALQHYNTITSRMQNFPINIELFSRAKSSSQQQKILKKLESGEIEIIVGTHRLVQNDVEFKDLGLAIIDEEQRFGVAHKERFKQLKKSVDVLSLSATPIPRTLNMAISGIRDMSVIEKAPQNRYPIQTYVMEYDDSIVTLAILKEMQRGGMVFYLHNRVESIDKCASRISALVPNARVYVAHGKMPSEMLSNIWQKLLEREADVLVCTTIIETGIDIPFCNTLIVENADRMGLSQLYQLRGRIGRSNKRAYAYMTFKQGKVLSDIASKRLSAIKEFTRFGSGFKIALRDLEIRGAGNILGAQQHGHMESVGYDMYLKILGEAVAEEKGENPQLLLSEECYIDVQVNAHLPENYIPNLSQRIDIYKKIAMVKTNDDYLDLVDELVDRFGDPPNVVMGLLDISLSRNLAIKNDVKEIVQKETSIYFYQDPFNIHSASIVSDELDNKVIINVIGRPCIEVKLESNDSVLNVIKKVLSALTKGIANLGVKQ